MGNTAHERIETIKRLAGQMLSLEQAGRRGSPEFRDLWSQVFALSDHEVRLAMIEDAFARGVINVRPLFDPDAPADTLARCIAEGLQLPLSLVTDTLNRLDAPALH